MFTIRNIGGAALFLFGTTYLWITPMFASRGISTKGTLWSITNVLAFLTLLGFTVATWGLFRAEWWDAVAIGSAMLGLIALIPFWIAAHNSAEVAPWFTVLIHVIGVAGVLVLLLVPSLHSWVNSHVTAGR